MFLHKIDILLCHGVCLALIQRRIIENQCKWTTEQLKKALNICFHLLASLIVGTVMLPSRNLSLCSPRLTSTINLHHNGFKQPEMMWLHGYAFHNITEFTVFPHVMKTNESKPNSWQTVRVPRRRKRKASTSWWAAVVSRGSSQRLKVSESDIAAWSRDENKFFLPEAVKHRENNVPARFSLSQ